MKTKRMRMEPRITTVTLGVTNFIRSLRFYRDGLGWPTRATDTSEIAVFSTTGTHFSIYPLHKLAEDISSALPPTRSGFSGITLGRNVCPARRSLKFSPTPKQAGAAIVKTAQDVFWGGHSGYFTDPDGYYWEVVFAPDFKFAADGSLLLDE